MSDCLFCKIASGQIPAKLLHDDEQCVSFADINPQAPFHALVIPRRHLATLNDLTATDEALVGHLLRVAAQVAKAGGVAETGWRASFNTNRDGGQVVFHVHLHVLGGRQMEWPPG
jgi:histidine triad (HIT) family protein